eukprot:12788913-Heterocapsa_arctica.AAC.1
MAALFNRLPSAGHRPRRWAACSARILCINERHPRFPEKASKKQQFGKQVRDSDRQTHREQPSPSLDYPLHLRGRIENLARPGTERSKGGLGQG